MGSRCIHVCCVCPKEPDHMHLFPPRECPDCIALTAQFLNAKKEADHEHRRIQ